MRVIKAIPVQYNDRLLLPRIFLLQFVYFQGNFLNLFTEILIIHFCLFIHNVCHIRYTTTYASRF